VALAIARTVVAELAAVYLELGIFIARREYPVLIVHKNAVTEHQLPLFKTDACTISIGNASAGKLDILHEKTAASQHPNTLSLSGGPVGNQPRAPLDAAYREPLLRPHGDIAAIIAGLDFHDVAICGRASGGGYGCVVKAGSDSQYSLRER
jgi:hypothetical protein